MTFYSFIGIAVTSATLIIFGQALWDPVAVLSRLGNPFAVVLAMLALLMATLNVNVAANVVSPANDFSNLSPRRISFRTGGLITCFMGIAMQPWKLMANYGSYIFGWLVGYSGFLGPIAGVLICDYFIVRKKILLVQDLYQRNGLYEYQRGLNWQALARTRRRRRCGVRRPGRSATASLVQLRLVCRLHRQFLRLFRIDAHRRARRPGRGLEGALAMEFGITIKPDLTVDRIVSLTRQAESVGFLHGWIFDSHVIWMEPFPLMTLMATEHEKHAPRSLRHQSRRSRGHRRVQPFCHAKCHFQRPHAHGHRPRRQLPPRAGQKAHDTRRPGKFCKDISRAERRKVCRSRRRRRSLSLDQRENSARLGCWLWTESACAPPDASATELSSNLPIPI